MSEFSIGRETILNGEKQIGRNRLNKDGTFSAFDFCEADKGGEVTVKCDGRTHIFTKGEDEGDVLKGWTYAPDPSEEAREGALELSNPPFRHLGVVAREGLALAFLDKQGIRSALGTIAHIGYKIPTSTNE